MVGAQFKGSAFGAIAGFVCGAAIAGVLGGILGAGLGIFVGLGLLYAIEHIGHSMGPVAPTRVRDKVYCYPRGRYAEGGFIRDMDNGKWLDIEQCSLCPEGQPDCRKDCLRLLNDFDRKLPESAKATV
jgi:hypothetical protein